MDAKTMVDQPDQLVSVFDWEGADLQTGPENVDVALVFNATQLQ